MRPSKCMSTFIIPIWDFLREMPLQVSDRLFSFLPAAYFAFCVQWLLHSLSPMFYDHAELLVEILQAIHINVYDVVAFCCNLFICLCLPLLTAPLLSFWFLTYIFFCSLLAILQKLHCSHKFIQFSSIGAVERECVHQNMWHDLLTIKYVQLMWCNLNG